MMEKDLTIPEIQDAFLKFVEEFHAKYEYESDFTKIANDLEIGIKLSTQDQSFNLKDERVILVNPCCSPSRFAFTGWHELSHHLFKMAHGGDLEAYLYECADGDTDQRYTTEEDLCFKAAARLLMPTHVMKAVVTQMGYSPLSVFELSHKTGASVEAAMRRIIWSRTTDVHTVLVDKSGYVLSSLSHGTNREKYSIGYQFHLKSEHPIRTRRFKPLIEERFTAPVPFKNSPRLWSSKVIAAANADESRILSFFFSNYPNDNILQGNLFEF